MKLTRKEFVGLVAASGVGSVIAARDMRAAVADGPPKKLEKTAIKGSTEAIVAFIRRASLEQMPPAAVAQAKRCLVDGFGVILAGSTVQGSAIVRDYVKGGTDKREATVLGSGGLQTSAAYAALANGASGHAMDFDDTQLSTTPDRTY